MTPTISYCVSSSLMRRPTAPGSPPKRARHRFSPITATRGRSGRVSEGRMLRPSSGRLPSISMSPPVTRDVGTVSGSPASRRVATWNWNSSTFHRACGSSRHSNAASGRTYAIASPPGSPLQICSSPSGSLKGGGLRRSASTNEKMVTLAAIARAILITDTALKAGVARRRRAAVRSTVITRPIMAETETPRNEDAAGPRLTGIRRSDIRDPTSGIRRRRARPTCRSARSVRIRAIRVS